MDNKNIYYVLIKPWGVYVKQAHFFESQGGTTSEWGKAWEKVKAKSLDDAHIVAEEIRSERCLAV